MDLPMNKTQMERVIKETGRMTNSMGKEYGFLRMGVNMMGSLNSGKSMVMVGFLYGFKLIFIGIYKHRDFVYSGDWVED